MKRILSLVVSLIMLFCFTTTSLASEKKFDLLDYLEGNPVTSHSQLMEILAENRSDVAVSMYTYSLGYPSDQEEIYFNIDIDRENDLVEVDVIYAETMMAASTRSGAAVHETYSAVGALMYTVTINGTFSYSSTSCSTTSKSGTFEKAPRTFWSSTPSVTSGSISTTKAYARISGTATFLLESSTYRLTLMCDTNGTLTSSFTRP